MTIAELLRRARRDVASAWTAVEAASQTAARRLRRAYRLDEARCNDLASEVMLVAARDDFAALRCADGSTPLVAWLAGIAQNLLRQERRREGAARKAELHDEDGSTEDPEPDASEDRPDAPAVERAAELVELLTPEQQRVFHAWFDARSEARAAGVLGVTRDHVHDVKRRGMSRIRKAERWRPRDDAAERQWALERAAQFRLAGDEVNAKVMSLHAEGRTRAEIAAALGVTADAVRGRIHRARMAR